MISIASVDKILSASTPLFPTTKRPLCGLCGCILREDIVADRDQPACDTVKMDGIAISFDDWRRGQKVFKICGIQRAGRAALRLPDPRKCVEVCTGAPLPRGADCVIPYEDLSHPGNGIAQIGKAKLLRWQNVRRQASEYRKNEVLLKTGTRLGPAQISVLAAVGKINTPVSQNPRVLIIGTGDELISPTRKPQAHQSRRSNTWAVKAVLRQQGYLRNKVTHLPDHPRRIKAVIFSAIRNNDVVIISGGISKGRFDYIPKILKECGVKIRIHGVRQQPGKPFLFGKTQTGVAVFGLPGNPVSTLVCATRYVLPYLEKASGITPRKPDFVQLLEAPHVHQTLTRFLPVKISSDEKKGRGAKILPFQDSGDFHAWAKADGYVEIPPTWKRNQRVRFFSW